MRQKILLGVLVALASAAAQPAVAQWYDRWDRGGFGVSVGFASPGYYDYGYAGYYAYGYPSYAYSYPRASYRYVRTYPSTYSAYAYADADYDEPVYAYSGYRSSRYAYAYDYPSYGYAYGYDYDYPGYGYASVGIGVTDRSWRGSRFYRDDGRSVAVRDRDFDRGDRFRQRSSARAEFVAGESSSRVQARGEGRIRAEGSRATVRSDATVGGRASVATEGRSSTGGEAGARIERRGDGAPMRANRGER
jgi:hypothetical protein